MSWPVPRWAEPSLIELHQGGPPCVHALTYRDLARPFPAWLDQRGRKNLAPELTISEEEYQQYSMGNFWWMSDEVAAKLRDKWGLSLADCACRIFDEEFRQRPMIGRTYQDRILGAILRAVSIWDLVQIATSTAIISSHNYARTIRTGVISWTSWLLIGLMLRLWMSQRNFPAITDLTCFLSDFLLLSHEKMGFINLIMMLLRDSGNPPSKS